jgi:RNA polymerase sigma-70 factor (ECF subfamily)
MNTLLIARPPVANTARPGLVAMAMGLLDTARRATRQALRLRAEGWALLREATGGDPASARELVRQLTPAALALARQVLGHTEDAEDAVQDSFLRLWNARPDDQRGAQLSTYFHTIVLNRCRSHLVRHRELAVEPETLTALHDRHQQDNETDTGTPPDTAQLHAALTRLPARQRMALAMWAYADADVNAIATALAIDNNAAHQLLHRAKRGLRTALQEPQP